MCVHIKTTTLPPVNALMRSWSLGWIIQVRCHYTVLTDCLQGFESTWISAKISNLNYTVHAAKYQEWHIPHGPWGTIVQQQASRQRNLKVDLGKCVQMYRAPFIYLPGASNSLKPPLSHLTKYVIFVTKAMHFTQSVYSILIWNITVMFCTPPLYKLFFPLLLKMWLCQTLSSSAFVSSPLYGPSCYPSLVY